MSIRLYVMIMAFLTALCLAVVLGGCGQTDEFSTGGGPQTTVYPDGTCETVYIVDTEVVCYKVVGKSPKKGPKYVEIDCP